MSDRTALIFVTACDPWCRVSCNLTAGIDNQPVFDYTTGIRAAGALAGPCNLQSATAGVMPIRGLILVELPLLSGADVWVLRNGNL